MSNLITSHSLRQEMADVLYELGAELVKRKATQLQFDEFKRDIRLREAQVLLTACEDEAGQKRIRDAKPEAIREALLVTALSADDQTQALMKGLAVLDRQLAGIEAEIEVLRLNFAGLKAQARLAAAELGGGE